MIIRGAALAPRAWPNGHGITRDVYGRTRPDGGHDWLLSIAELAGDAPFSHFPDSDRVFTLIAGDAVTLWIDGHAMICRPWVPAGFPGDRSTRCIMGPTPARAFNLFVDRRAGSGTVTALTVAAGHTIRVPASAIALYCAQGSLSNGCDVLDVDDTVVDFASGTITASANGATCLLVSFYAAG